jgi:hypothetical protein
VASTARRWIGLGVFLLVVALAASCAQAAALGSEGSAGGGSAPGHTAPGSPGGSAPGSGAGAGPQPCGTPIVSGTGPNGTVAYAPCPGQEPPTPHPQVVVPSPGMAGVHPIAFDHAGVAGDDVTVTIDFVSGVEPCSVLDHVDVSYGADAVTITLYEGHDPSADEVACPAIAVFKQVVVTLDQPLGDRKILDGAA